MKDRKEIESLKARQAELARELNKLDGQIKKLETEQTEKYRIGAEFVPGWEIVEIELNSNGSSFKKILTIIQETKGQIYTPHTRYNWPEILKKYPEAQWASTDADGRVDLWQVEPEPDQEGKKWIGIRCLTVLGGYCRYINGKGWRGSIEKRPDNL